MDFIWTTERKRNQTLIFSAMTPPLSGEVMLEIAAENAFELYVNGVFIGKGPVRAAHGCSVPMKVHPRCTGEPLEIHVYVSYYGIETLSHINHDPFFGAELTENGVVKLTTAEFSTHRQTEKIIKTARYSPQRQFLEAYQMNSPRDPKFRPLCQTRLVPGNRIIETTVPVPLYPIARPVSAQKCFTVQPDASAKLPERPLKQLHTYDETPIEGFSYEELEDYSPEEAACLTMGDSCWTEVTSSTHVSLVPPPIFAWQFDFGRSLAGSLCLHVVCDQPTDLFLIWDEILNEKGHVDFIRMITTYQIAKWHLEPGDYHLHTFEPYCMRYAELIDCSGAAQISEVTIRIFENPLMYRAQLQSTDPDWELLFKAAQRTTAQCTFDLPIDCPSRERGAALMDSYFTLRSEALLSGENLIARHFYRQFTLADRPMYHIPGLIPFYYPAEFPRKDNIVLFSLWYVIQLADEMRRTGKVPLEAKENCDRVLKYFAAYLNKEGLLEDVPGWLFLEWSKAGNFTTGVNFPVNILWCAAQRSYGSMFRDDATLTSSDSLAGRILNLARREDGYLADQAIQQDGVLQLTAAISEYHQYLAIHFGISDEAHTTLMLSLPDLPVNMVPVGQFPGFELKAHALAFHGLCRQALDLLRETQLPMAVKTGTLWEHLYLRQSLCHGFAGYATVVLARALTGYCYTDRNTIYLADDYAGVDCFMSIPVSANQRIEIIVHHDERQLIVPDNYQVKKGRVYGF